MFDDTNRGRTGRRVFPCLLLLFTLPASSDESVALKDLDSGEGVRESGLQLMQLSFGLHRLEPETEGATSLLIGVHGYQSQGYEWVYPLQTMDDEQTTTYFYRWDFTKCPDQSARDLIQSIKKLLDSDGTTTKLTVVGHSLGGVLVSALIDDWPFEQSTDLHAVAAPLAGLGSFSEECGKFLPDRIPPTIRFLQWRTQHKLDGAYRNLDEDPQIVSLAGSVAVTLPETYRDRRLGHNWAVSWVADRIASAKELD